MAFGVEKNNEAVNIEPAITQTEELVNVVSLQAQQSFVDNKQEVNLDAILSNPVSLNEVGNLFTADEKRYILDKLGFEGLESDADIPFTATFMIVQIENFSLDDAYKVMKETLVEHDGDINFPGALEDTFRKYIRLYETSSETKDKLSEALGPEVPKKVNHDSKPFELTIKKFFGSKKEKLDDFASDEKKNSDEYFNTNEKATSSDSVDEFSLDWRFLARVEAGIVAFWSPYPEVRAVTFPYDDPNERCETFRAYLISVIWQCIGTFINTYFAARQPPITFSANIGQVFIYPCGLFVALAFPKWKIPLGFGYLIDLNPGPWTYKEQMFASLIYFVAGLQNGIYKIIFVQKAPNLLYTNWDTWGYQILLGISSSYMGFGIAGLMRSLYVYPVKAMWPTMLPTVAVNDALMAPEKKENINGWKISRYGFFFVTFVFSFLYYWFPDYIFQALSSFSWLSWIRPNNLDLDVITGFNSGLGLNPFPSFDFNILLFLAPLAAPFYSTILTFIGVCISFFAIVGMWYTNYKWTGYLPVNSQSLFDNTGNVYNVSRVVDENNRFDKDAYTQYSPPFYSAGLLMSYGASFAAVPLTVFYVIGVYYKQLWEGLVIVKKVLFSRKGSSFKNFDDPFCRMNSSYKEVPEWWFLVVLVISIVLAIVCVEIYPTQTPVWTIFFSLAFNTIFMVPFLQVYSTTGAYISLTTVIELIIGYAVRGNGISILIGSLFGYSIDEQAQNYITNQKIAHYAKVPPQAMFRGQLFTTFINIIITIAVVNWQANFPNICTAEQENKFSCPTARGAYNTAISWGVIGPYRVIGELYPILKWSFLIGFLVAIPFVLLKWYGPKKLTKFVHPIVMIQGMTIWAPYNMSYYIGGVYFAIFFMKYLKDRYTAWWSKYNYLFYAGIQAGIAFSSIIIFFTVYYHPKDINWWGNDVVEYGIEGDGGMGRLDPTTDPDGYFGPRIGEFY